MILISKKFTAIFLALVLILPLAANTVSATETVGHSVKNGESLWIIAKKYGIAFQSILDANADLKNPNLIYPNQIVRVPLPSSDENNGGNGSQGVASFREQVLALTNKYRTAQGLSPLTLDSSISNAAQAKADDMAKNNYFSHTSPTYGSPSDLLNSFGISWRFSGENIAKGFYDAESVLTAWMNSAGHRANILNSSFTKLGVGYNSKGGYWVQEFVG
ncbi:MAG: LysM peptidoglycan-binding domain-containing protein [Clostridia bacterium]|nr:LysM peptidoglycan-binding domain-containing protein [Clostridia bacterium]